MRTPMALVVAAAMASEGCASLWGFDDLTQSEAGVTEDAYDELANHGDAYAPARDAVTDSPLTMDAPRSSLDVSIEAPTTDASQPDANVDAGDACTLVQHSDGLGQTFYDCVPLGSYGGALPYDACQAFTWTGFPGSVGKQCANKDGKVTSETCCGTASTGEACWGYSGEGTGHVCTAAYPNFCCPETSDPAYQ